MKLKFVKLANNWYVQLPDYEGSVEDLEMVCGAEVLCEELDKDRDGIVEAEVTSNNECDYDVALDFLLSTIDETGEQSGANYIVSCNYGTIVQEVWLCNVVKYLFKCFPATIYIKMSK